MTPKTKVNIFYRYHIKPNSRLIYLGETTEYGTTQMMRRLVKCINVGADRRPTMQQTHTGSNGECKLIISNMFCCEDKSICPCQTDRREIMTPHKCVEKISDGQCPYKLPNAILGPVLRQQKRTK